MKRWSPTSNVTPTPTSDSHSSPPLTYLDIFSHLSNTILTFLQAVEPNLQSHPYANIRFRFLFSPYLPKHFSPHLYLHFYFSWSGGAQPPTSPLHQHQIRIPLFALPIRHFFPVFLPPFYRFLKRWSLTSNGTPTATSVSDFTPRLTYLTIFSRLSTAILTFLKAVEHYL